MENYELENLRKNTLLNIASKYRKNENVKKIIDEYTIFLPIESSSLQRVFHFAKEIKEIQKCPYCDKSKRFVKVTHYWDTCCSKECKHHYRSDIRKSFSEEKNLKMKEKAKNTIKEKYGSHANMIEYTPEYLSSLETMKIEELKILDIALLCKIYYKLEIIQNIIDNETKTLGDFDNISQKIYHFKTGLNVPLCQCKSQLKYRNKGKYRKSCGDNFCANKEREISCFDEYGCKNISQNDEAKNKAIETNLKKYGEVNHTKTEAYKIKSKEFFMNKYGVDNPSKLEEVKQKKIATSQKNYGTDYPIQTKEVFDRILKSGYKIIKYKDTGLFYQNSYELDFLNKYYDKIKVEQIGNIKYEFNGKMKYYRTDYYLPEFHLLIEIKSDYWLNKQYEMNLAKQKACLEQGFNFMFVINKDYSELEQLLKDKLMLNGDI